MAMHNMESRAQLPPSGLLLGALVTTIPLLEDQHLDLCILRQDKGEH